MVLQLVMHVAWEDHDLCEVYTVVFIAGQRHQAAIVSSSSESVIQLSSATKRRAAFDGAARRHQNSLTLAANMMHAAQSYANVNYEKFLFLLSCCENKSEITEFCLLLIVWGSGHIRSGLEHREAAAAAAATAAL